MAGPQVAPSSGRRSPFVDEVYIGRMSASTFDIFDGERVEMLRGPQGTLFGRNVSGGAISITTVKPGKTFEGRGQVTVGNYTASKAAPRSTCRCPMPGPCA